MSAHHGATTSPTALTPIRSRVALQKAEVEQQLLARQEHEQAADRFAMEATGRFDKLLGAIHQRMRARAAPAAAASHGRRGRRGARGRTLGDEGLRPSSRPRGGPARGGGRGRQGPGLGGVVQPAAAAAWRMAPHSVAARRAADLAAAAAVHSLFAEERAVVAVNRAYVARRRRRSWSPRRRRVLRRVEAPPHDSKGEAVHDVRAARGPWAPGASEGPAGDWRCRVACARCGRAAALVATFGHPGRRVPPVLGVTMPDLEQAARHALCPAPMVGGEPRGFGSAERGDALTHL